MKVAGFIWWNGERMAFWLPEGVKVDLTVKR